MNPYVFIVGCPRSGTTLLRRMVNAHPQIAVTPETHWIPRFFEKRKGLTPEGMVTRKLILQLPEQPRFTRLGMGREELMTMISGTEPVSYSSLVTGIFDSYGRAQGKALVGDKTPGYVRSMKTLHALWPEARFVHLIRDGRDVYLSMRYRPLHHLKPGVLDTWAEEPATAAALWWELNVRGGRRSGNSLGPGLYYEIRYESLVADPASQCVALCDFLGLPYDEAMVCFYDSRRKAPSDAGGDHRWMPITPGLRNWKTQMAVEDVERFEAAAGGLLHELGYPPAFPRPQRDMVAENPLPAGEESGLGVE